MAKQQPMEQPTSRPGALPKPFLKTDLPRIRRTLDAAWMTRQHGVRQACARKARCRFCGHAHVVHVSRLTSRKDAESTACRLRSRTRSGPPNFCACATKRGAGRRVRRAARMKRRAGRHAAWGASSARRGARSQAQPGAWARLALGSERLRTRKYGSRRLAVTAAMMEYVCARACGRVRAQRAAFSSAVSCVARTAWSAQASHSHLRGVMLPPQSPMAPARALRCAA